MSWDELPDEDPPALAAMEAHAAVVVDRGKAAQIEVIKELEDELLKVSLDVTRDALNFADIPEELESVPEEWISLMGRVEAEKRFRRMKASWKSAKYAPVGIGLAASVATKIIKARSAEKAAPRALAIVMLPAPDAPMPYFEVRDVNNDD